MKAFRQQTLSNALIALGMVFGSAAWADDKMAPMPGHSDGSMQMHQIMADGQKMPMTMTGDVDKDFAMMMTMHHHQALKMADVMIQSGTNAKLKAMAQKMKKAQTKEIKELAPFTK